MPSRSPGVPGPRSRPRHIVVVGGGVTGLAAALAVCDGSADSTAGRTVPPRVTVLEQSGQFGGKLRSATLDWDGGAAQVELGADAVLARVPAGLKLAERLGLDSQLLHPATGQAHIALPDGLHALPRETVMGVPASPSAIIGAGLVTAAGAARMQAERDAPGEPLIDDVSVGEIARRRLGDEVTENLIDPLLGGVYAGDVDTLSLQATLPAVAAQLREHPSLIAAADAVMTSRSCASPAAGPTTGPTFAAVRGGMSRLVAELERVLRAMRTDAGPRVTLRTGATVRRLRRTGSETGAGWELTVGPAGSVADAELLHADAVLLATPALAARRLLEETSPSAAAELAGIPYASVAVINLALPALPAVAFPAGSGVLVPSAAGRTVKAVTFTDQKWHRDVPGARLLRVSVGRHSVGRHGDGIVSDSLLHRDDADLIDVVMADLRAILGPLPSPLATAVYRWGGALPQYLVGHPDRVRRAREALAGIGGIALAGAGYDGVGVAACIASAYRAAEVLVDTLSVPETRSEGEQQ